MKHYILANPVCGKGKAIVISKRVKSLLAKYNIDSEIIISEYKGHFTKIVKELSTKQKCRFYCVGGDGTLNEIVTGIVGTDSEIVVVGAGTGNDFLRTISKFSSMRKIIKNSINKEATPTDVIIANDKYYAINVLSVGFDAIVAKNIDKFRKIPLINGKMKYFLSILYSLAHNKNFKLKLHTESIIFKRYFTLIAVANGKYYGGGIKISPQSVTTDGFANICSIESTGIIKKLFLLPLLSNGKHINKSIVGFARSADATIVSTREFPVNIDGEIFYINKLHIKVIPNAINVVYINKI